MTRAAGAVAPGRLARAGRIRARPETRGIRRNRPGLPAGPRPPPGHGPGRPRLGGARPDRPQPAAQVDAGHGHLGQRPGRHGLPHREQAEHGRAGPGPDRLPDRGRGGQPQRRGGQLSVPAQRGAERRPQHLAGPRPFLPLHQRGAGQLGGADRGPAAGPRVVRADHDGQPVGRHHPGPQAGRCRGPFHEAQVGPAFRDQDGHRLAVRRDQGYLGRGPAGLLVVAAQRHQPGRDQVLGHGEAGRDPEVGVPGPAEAGDAGVQGAGQVQQRRRPVRQQRAGRGQPGPARVTFQQHRADLRLHRAQPGRCRLLADPGVPGRGADAAQPGHRHEQLQRPQLGDVRAQRHGTTITEATRAGCGLTGW